jgi:uncharacterized protein (DUF1684 family)
VQTNAVQRKPLITPQRYHTTSAESWFDEEEWHIHAARRHPVPDELALTVKLSPQMPLSKTIPVNVRWSKLMIQQ